MMNWTKMMMMMKNMMNKDFMMVEAVENSEGEPMLIDEVSKDEIEMNYQMLMKMMM
jgi:hypothetical protein